MIGWKPKPFIFVHIPKCAGTSIEQSLLPLVTQRNAFRELTPDDRHRYWLPGVEALQHRRLRAYARNFRVSGYFKFAFVRNPWDRAVSQIHYLATVARWRFLLGKTFKEQLRDYCNTKAMVWGHDLRASQVDYLTGISGVMEMDFIGRFETLNRDFGVVCDGIGIQPVPQLPHVFDSRRKLHYSAFYDADSAELISQRFSRDIDFFGYRFERLAGPDSTATGGFSSASAIGAGGG